MPKILGDTLRIVRNFSRLTCNLLLEPLTIRVGQLIRFQAILRIPLAFQKRDFGAKSGSATLN